jgi:hypothetical protein
MILQIAAALAIGAYVVLSKDAQSGRPDGGVKPVKRLERVAPLGVDGGVLAGCGTLTGAFKRRQLTLRLDEYSLTV